jgi:hypothetical protein
MFQAPPYSIQAYEPDDRMGGWIGLANARRELDRRDLALILDFVPNHTVRSSMDHGASTRDGLLQRGLNVRLASGGSHLFTVHAAGVE